jgi:arylformamidase
VTREKQIFDITPLITSKLAVWPGDTQPSREVLLDIARGDNLTLSTLRATVHLGAHADGPNHYGKDARAIDERSLDYYLGPCEVIRLNVAHGDRVTPDMLRNLPD